MMGKTVRQASTSFSEVFLSLQVPVVLGFEVREENDSIYCTTPVIPYFYWTRLDQSESVNVFSIHD